MTDYFKLYQDYGSYNVHFNQLNLTSPSVEYAWRRTKKLLHDEAKKQILATLEHNPFVTICDIGCGNGGLLIRLAQELQDARIKFTGFDISEPFIDFANSAVKAKNLENIKFKLYDVEKEPLPDTYHVIISSEVLEHLKNPEQFIQTVYSHLYKNGSFLLSTPNAKNAIKYPFKFLKPLVSRHNETELKKSLTNDEETFKLAEEEQHIKTFSHKELKAALEKTGFTIYGMPRSTTFFGGPFLDTHRLLWGMTILFDVIMDQIPFPNIGWDCIVFSQKT